MRTLTCSVAMLVCGGESNGRASTVEFTLNCGMLSFSSPTKTWTTTASSATFSPETHRHRGAVLLTVGRSYVGNDDPHSALLDRACSYENLPKCRSYRISSTAPKTLQAAVSINCVECMRLCSNECGSLACSLFWRCLI